MADTSSKDPSFNILGSEKLNTATGGNPPKNDSNSPTYNILGSEKLNTAGGANPVNKDSEHHKKACIEAHNALEDRLREKERLARWKRD